MSRFATGRIVAVDFWRGFALCMIFVDHVPGNVYDRLTYRNFGFSDATEIFVLLAGIAAAFAYLPRMTAGHVLSTGFRILQRAFQLYMAHIVLIIAGCTIIGYTVSVTGDTRFLTVLHLDTLVDNTVPALVGLMLLGLQPAYLNILPLYITVLLMAPPMLLLVRKSPVAALLASGALYVAVQLLGVNFPTFPDEGTWFFNPLAWQLLFVIGLVLGRMILCREPMRPCPLLLALSIAYLVIALVWTLSGFYPTWNLSPLPLFIWEFDKTNLYLPRLLHVLALLVVVAHLPMERWLRSHAWARPLAVLGGHSLPVFCLSTVLALTAQVVRALSGGGIVLDTAVIGGGLAAQFALAGVLEWYRSGQQAQAQRSAAQRSS